MTINKRPIEEYPDPQKTEPRSQESGVRSQESGEKKKGTDADLRGFTRNKGQRHIVTKGLTPKPVGSQRAGLVSEREREEWMRARERTRTRGVDEGS